MQLHAALLCVHATAMTTHRSLSLSLSLCLCLCTCVCLSVLLLPVRPALLLLLLLLIVVYASSIALSRRLLYGQFCTIRSQWTRWRHHPRDVMRRQCVGKYSSITMVNIGVRCRYWVVCMSTCCNDSLVSQSVQTVHYIDEWHFDKSVSVALRRPQNWLIDLHGKATLNRPMLMLSRNVAVGGGERLKGCINFIYKVPTLAHAFSVRCRARRAGWE